MAKRILVPVESNERAAAVVPVVAALARDGGGTVRLLSVQPAPRTRFGDDTGRRPLYGYDVGFVLDAFDRAAAYGHAQEAPIEFQIIEHMRRLDPLLDGVPIEHAVRFGDVVDEIVREADAFEADLVAVTERCRPWWRPALTRIVDRVRARVRVPVLALCGGVR